MKILQTILSGLLVPFAWLYGLATSVRNRLFDSGLLPVESFNIPMISVGNLSAGGTGKTPHIEYLVRLLSRNYRIAVLSRGYRRKSKGFVLADDKATAQTLGDEPMQIYRKFPNIIVAVDADRRAGIRRLLADYQPEIILLDDAFQHRYVRAGLSILLTDWRRPFWRDRLLPVGRLREAGSGYRRADMIIVSKTPDDFHIDDKDFLPANLNIHPLFSRFQYRSLQPVFPQQIRKESLERLKKDRYSLLLVAGIAHPENLIRHLQNYTTQLSVLRFADHHDFTQKDVEKIEQTFNNITTNHKIIITTEKDAVRLMKNAYLSDEIRQALFYLPIEVVFVCPEQEELFKSTIEDYVKKIRRNRILA